MYYGVVAGLLSVVVPIITKADGVNTTFKGVGIDNPLRGGVKTIPDLLVLLINQFVLPIGGVIVVFMFIYTGFLYVMARGNSSEVSKAHESFKNTVIGAAIILGALSVSVIIKATVGQLTDAIK